MVSSDIEGTGKLVISGSKVLEGAAIGDSMNVNGCCLTIVAFDANSFSCDVMPESARRTNLGRLSPGDGVNLEASLRFGERVGGHLVTGHVDGVGTVRRLRPDGNSVWVTFEVPTTFMHCLVEKGCVSVDGMSLTVVDVLEDGFTVALTPHTVAVTTAQFWVVGSVVNLEGDMMAKYVQRGAAIAATDISPVGA